jgi:hypothetical protein
VTVNQRQEVVAVKVKERAVVLLLMAGEEIPDDLRDALPALERVGVVKDGGLVDAVQYLTHLGLIAV